MLSLAPPLPRLLPYTKIYEDRMRRRHITKPLHTHNPVKTIPEDAPSQAVCRAGNG